MLRRTALIVAVLLSAGQVRWAFGAPAVVATTGTTSDIGVISSISDCAIDGDDRVTFLATSAALFSTTGSSPQHVLAAGDPLPGGGVLASLGTPTMAPGGCVVLRAAGSGVDGVLRRCGAQAEWVVRRGDPAPDGPLVTVVGGSVGGGPGEAVAFTARRDDGVTALYRVTPDGMVEIARTGVPAPRGGTFSDFRPIGVTADGLVGFRALVDLGPDGLFVGDGTTLTPIVLVNDPVPVVGGLFTQVGEATFNAAGQWAFRGRVSGNGPTGVFLAESTGPILAIEPLALEGTPTPIGGTYAQFASSLVPSIDTAGHVAFRVGIIDGAAASAVFLAARGSPTTAALSAGQETVAGAVLEPGNPLLADDGGLLVPGTLPGNRAGFFAVRGNVITPVAVFGDTTDLGENVRFIGAALRDTLSGALLLGQREAIVRSTDGGLSLVATLGDRSPLGGVFARFDPPAAGTDGTTVVRADVRDGRANEVLLAIGRSGTRSVAAAGRRAPGGGRFLAFSSGGVDVQVRPGRARTATAFQSRLSGSSSASGLFVQSDGHRMRAIALAGHRAPGGGRFAAFGSPTVDDAGHVAFLARLSGANGSIGLFSGGASRVRRVALVGTPTGSRLSGSYALLESPVVGRLGLVFRGVLNRQGSQAIFLHRGSHTEAVIATSDPAPDGAVFVTVDDPTIVGKGVAFLGRERGASVSGGFYRIARVLSSGVAAATADRLAALGETTPVGGTYLAFGRPNGNARGKLAITATIESGQASSAVLRFDP